MMDILEELGISEGLAMSVVLILNGLSDEEINTLRLVTMLGTDPRGKLFWDKGQVLYTEQENGIPKLHNATKDLVLRYKR